MCIFVQQEDGRTFCMSCSMGSKEDAWYQFHHHLPGKPCAPPCECSADYDRETLIARIEEAMSKWPR